MLQRRLSFRYIVPADVLSYVFGYACTTVFLAWRGFGVWSLAAGTVAQNVLLWLVQRLCCRERPGLGWNKDSARQLMRFGGGVTLISMFEYLGGNLDVIVSGKIWSESVVGLYTKVSQLVTLPIEYISNALTAPVFPAMCAAKDLNALREEYISDFLLVCIVEFSICIGMALSAEELISVVLGQQWMAGVGVFSVCCIAHAFNYSNTVIGITLEAMGRLKVKLVLQWTQIAVLMGCIYIFRDLGVWGIAWAVLIAHAYKFFGLQLVIGRFLKWTAHEIGLLVSSLSYVVVVQSVFQLIASVVIRIWSLPVLAALIFHVVLGAAALAVVCIFFPTKWIRKFVPMTKILKTFLHR